MGAFMPAHDGPLLQAAVNNLMYSYNESLKPYGGGATALCPGNINSNIGEAEKHRPAHLRNTGYNVTEKTIGLLKSIHAQGMDPVELANHLKAGIENNQPLVIPYPNPQQMLRQQHETIEFFCTPASRLEEKRREMEERMKDFRSGYGTPASPRRADKVDLSKRVPD